MKRSFKFGVYLLVAAAIQIFQSASAQTNLIVNGGFESGYGLSASNWTLTGGAGLNTLSSVDAHSGTNYLILGQAVNEIDSTYQTITIPSSATNVVFSFWYNIESSEGTTTAFDNLTVSIRNTSLSVLTIVTNLSNKNKDAGNGNPYYHTNLFNLTTYKGNTIVIYFNSTNDYSNPTAFRIDDVSVLAYIPQYTVSVSAGPNGSVSHSGNNVLQSGTQLTLTAIPNANYVVDQWYTNGVSAQVGGNALTINVAASENITVTFKRLYALTVQIFGLGTCAINPPGNVFTNGTPITITATPKPGYDFNEWTGAQYSRSATMVFDKGGSDETIQLYFMPHISPDNLNMTMAQTTPTTIGVTVPTPNNGVILLETTSDLLASFWKLVYVIQGNTIPTQFQMPNNGGNEYSRITYYPPITTKPFLTFPVHDGHTPYTASVISIMDHSMTNFTVRKKYDKDKVLRTCQGDTYPVSVPGPGNDYSILPNGTIVSTIFNYVGVAGQGGSSYLQYDGHPGYDYQFGLGTDIYAAASGEIITDNDLAGSNLAGIGMISYYMTYLHALVIQHPQGYCTIYMHLSDIDPSYVDKSDPNNWKPVKAIVNAGDHIGKSGAYDTVPDSPPIGPHFHFEVWRLDGTNWSWTDPYGYYGPDTNGVVQSIYPNLWIGN